LHFILVLNTVTGPSEGSSGIPQQYLQYLMPVSREDYSRCHLEDWKSN